MNTKTCSKCSKEKSLDNFNKEKSRKDGFYPWCKLCLKEHRAARYKKRPREFYINNKVCSWCKEDKPRTEFNLTSSRNLKPRCKSCEELIVKNPDKRRCGSCKEFLELKSFYKSRRDGHHSTCISCTIKSYEKLSEKEKRRDKSLKKYFGISLDQYKTLLKEQNYKCPICLKVLEGISNPVDHAHKGLHIGKIRAILHDRCNRFVMWKHEDSEELRRAADLIDNPLTNLLVPEEFIKGRKKKRKKRNGKKRRSVRRH